MWHYSRATHPKITFSSPGKLSLSLAPCSVRFSTQRTRDREAASSVMLPSLFSLIKKDTHPFSNQTHPAKHSCKLLLRASYEIAHLSLNTSNCPLKLTTASRIIFSFNSSVGYLSCLLVPPHPNLFSLNHAALKSTSVPITCCYATVLESISKAKPPPHRGIKMSTEMDSGPLKSQQPLFIMTSTPEAWPVWRGASWGGIGAWGEIWSHTSYDQIVQSDSKNRIRVAGLQT